jgi:hypothetical protein
MQSRSFPMCAERTAPPRRELSQCATRSPFSHLAALRRGSIFIAAAVALITPMAVATRHAEAEMTLMHCWPLDLSVPAPHAMLLPDLRASGGVR